MNLAIRDALPQDAEAGCIVLQRSITELCADHHKNDQAVLSRWLRNKTPDSFRAWIAQPGNSLLVAVVDDHVLAVGSVTDAGHITLNYVSPDVRFRGVSKALLGALETRAMERGCSACTLNSTETARRFYRANGYVEAEQPAGQFGASSGYPMSKLLSGRET